MRKATTILLATLLTIAASLALSPTTPACATGHCVHTFCSRTGSPGCASGCVCQLGPDGFTGFCR